MRIIDHINTFKYKSYILTHQIILQGIRILHFSKEHITQPTSEITFRRRFTRNKEIICFRIVRYHAKEPVLFHIGRNRELKPILEHIESGFCSFIDIKELRIRTCNNCPICCINKQPTCFSSLFIPLLIIKSITSEIEG